MSSEDASETRDDPSAGNRAHLRLSKGPLAGPVLCRVVSMVLTRANWPVDRMDDAMLVCDALSTHAPDYSSDGTVSFALTPQSGEGNGSRDVELSVEELVPDGAAAIVRDAMLPGVGNVLEKIAKRLMVEPTEDGSRLRIVLGRS